ncbi:MAG: efflux RND transporter permease subunit, partial [Paracoccaceae bacterium]|nr:efflux RND transporter permease subunit [Paracoccaceae bacterium]
GHASWGVPLSMFSVVGLIGLAGIIINDSIVLVTTVDEYAASRGLIPAIVDGAADRLRPVFLTTATTVFGLAPLLFERSQDAQFLKPTVITLVYGLGFGVVLVLLLVPALLAAQQDVRHQLRALRRALRPGRDARGVGLVAGLAAAAVAGLFGVTLGARLATGALPTPLRLLLPEGAGIGATAALFLGLAAAFLVVVYAGAVLARALRARRAG